MLYIVLDDSRRYTTEISIDLLMHPYYKYIYIYDLQTDY